MTVTVSGLTQIGDVSQNDTMTQNGTPLESGGQSRWFIPNVVSGELAWVELPFTTPQNLTNAQVLFGFYLRTDKVTTGTFRIGLYSQSNTNYRTWSLTHSNTADNDISNCYCLNPLAPNFTDVGTFNIESVVGIRVQYISNGTTNGTISTTQISTRATGSSSIPFRYFYRLDGQFSIQGGTSEAPASLSFVGDHLRTFLYFDSPVRGMFQEFSNNLSSVFNVSITGSTIFENTRSTNLVFRNAVADNGRILQPRNTPRLTINTTEINNFRDLFVTDQGASGFVFEDNSSVANTYRDVVFTNPSSVVLGNKDYTRLRCRNAKGAVVGGKVVSLSITESTSATAAYVIGAGTVITSLSISGSTSAYGIDLSAKSGTLDLSSLVLEDNDFSVNTILYNSAENLTVLVPADTIATGSGSSDFGDATVSGGGTLTIEAPQSEIVFTGLPDVEDVRLLFRNGGTETDQFFTVTGGTITLPTDASATYTVRADAPGYLASDYIELLGNTPQFRFSLVNRRNIYDAGVTRFDRLIFNPSTFEIFVTDGPALSPEDAFRTIEDYLVLVDDGVVPGLLYTAHPIPVTIPGRFILRFVYDLVNDTLNPARIKPHPDNTGDPELLFEIELERAEEFDIDPTYGLLDYSDSPAGRIIRVRSQVAIANVTISGDGALTTDQANQLSTAATVATRVDGLIEPRTPDAGDRFKAEALEEVAGSGLDAAGVRAAVGLAAANLDTQLGAIDTVVDEILLDTAQIGTAGAGLTEAGGTGDQFTAIPTIASVTTVGTVTNPVTAGTVSDKVGYGLADGAITSAKVADGTLTAAKFAAGAFEAVWSVATRTLTSLADSAGVTTLLGRATEARLGKLDVTGTLANTDNAATFRATGFATAADVTDAQSAIISQGNSAWVTANVSALLTSTAYTSSLPTNFGSLAITAEGAVTATNGGGGGGGDDAPTIYSYFASESRADAFKADVSGLSTLDAGDLATALESYDVAKVADVQVTVDGGFTAEAAAGIEATGNRVLALSKRQGLEPGISATVLDAAPGEPGSLTTSDEAIAQTLTINEDGSVTIENTPDPGP
jgi:hypothetical protein